MALANGLSPGSQGKLTALPLAGFKGPLCSRERQGREGMDKTKMRGERAEGSSALLWAALRGETQKQGACPKSELRRRPPLQFSLVQFSSEIFRVA